MTHKGALLCLLSLACLLQVGQCVVYPTLTFDGWDVIFLDRPSYLFSLQHGYNESILYVFGQNELRLVTTGRNFTVQDHQTAVEWNQPFISLHVFHNGTDLWAIGPTTPSDNTASPEGYDLPMALAGPVWHTQQVDGLQGFMLYNVYVDDRNKSDILAYGVGWLPIAGGTNETVNQVAFGVVRIHVNLNLPYSQREFNFDYAVDTLPLSYNRFTIFTTHNKPHIHYDWDTEILVVVDPSTSTVYSLQVGPGTSPMSKLRSNMISRSGLSIVSSFFHADTNLLYVGFAAQGVGNGSVVSVDIGTINVQHSVTFGQSLGNPRAIGLDEPTDTIYVGFNGGNAVVKLDYLLTIEGYQRVPDYLVRIEAGHVGEDHVYFITNEQHAKVIRVNKSDFCPTLCPHWGYCKAGKCVCDPYFHLSDDGLHCHITNTTITKGEEKGAAIALGILFALSFVLAVIGWVLYWRVRKGGYQQV